MKKQRKSTDLNKKKIPLNLVSDSNKKYRNLNIQFDSHLPLIKHENIQSLREFINKSKEKNDISNLGIEDSTIIKSKVKNLLKLMSKKSFENDYSKKESHSFRAKGRRLSNEYLRVRKKSGTIWSDHNISFKNRDKRQDEEKELNSTEIINKIYSSKDDTQRSNMHLFKNTINVVKNTFSEDNPLIKNNFTSFSKEKISEMKCQSQSKGSLSDSEAKKRFNTNFESLENNPLALKHQRNIKKIEREDNKRKLKISGRVYDSVSEEENDDIYIGQTYLILPTSTGKTIWDIFCAIWIIYSIFYVPVKIAFEDSDSIQGLYFDTFIDLVFLSDIIITFFTGYYDEEDNLILNHRLIVKKYLTGWFFLDLISSFPVGLIIILTVSNGDNPSTNKHLFNLAKITRFYRLLKWLRVMRIFRLGVKSKNSMISKKFQKGETPVSRFVKFLLFLLILTHIISCFFIYLGKINYIDSYNTSWLNNHSLSESSNTDIFIAAIYFTLTTIFTIGYGDIVPRSFWEYVYIICILTIGCGVFSFTLSSISTIFVQSDVKTQVFDNKHQTLDEIDKEYKLPSELYKKLKKTIKYDFHKWNEDRIGFLNNLPTSLKSTLYMRMYSKQIKVLQFFQDQCYDFILFVIPLLKSGKFYKNDLLIGIGEIVEEMYLVVSGELSVTLGKKYDYFKVAEIRKGFHFGDIIMYSKDQSNYILKVKSNVAEILIIKKTDFAQIKLNYSASVNEILKKSISIYGLIEKRRNQICNYYRRYRNLKDFKLNSKYYIIPGDDSSDDSDEFFSSKKIVKKLNFLKKSVLDDQIIDEQIANFRKLNNSESNESFKEKKKISFKNIHKELIKIESQEDKHKKLIPNKPKIEFKEDKIKKDFIKPADINQTNEDCCFHFFSANESRSKVKNNIPFSILTNNYTLNKNDQVNLNKLCGNDKEKNIIFINNLNINYNNDNSKKYKNEEECKLITETDRKDSSFSENVNIYNKRISTEEKNIHVSRFSKQSGYSSHDNPSNKKLNFHNLTRASMTFFDHVKLSNQYMKKNFKKTSNINSNIFLSELNDQIANAGFLNNNQEIVNQYLKDFLGETGKNSMKIKQQIVKLRSLEKLIKQKFKK